jgi:hypothetical protein
MRRGALPGLHGLRLQHPCQSLFARGSTGAPPGASMERRMRLSQAAAGPVWRHCRATALRQRRMSCSKAGRLMNKKIESQKQKLLIFFIKTQI